MNIQGFYTGREFDADTFFGAHPYEGGTHFAVWAPSARDVKVITSGLSDGSWAEWQMHRSYSGCWEKCQYRFQPGGGKLRRCVS